MKTRVLTRSEVEQVATMELAVAAVESAFGAFGRGEATMPSKVYLAVDDHDGDFRAMPARLGSSAGIKWVNVHEKNRKRYGLPTVMGELIVGVLVGPAVFGLIEPSEAVSLLAEIGIFFLMFHAGVETQPTEFFHALKRSLGVALVGAAVPFAVSFGVATYFGLGRVGATFVGLTMTATAVV